jgi:hypothetical protein
MGATGSSWALSDDERATLAAALDALLPPDGSFPAPSRTGLIDDFILRRVPAAGAVEPLPYPRVDSDGLRAILAGIAALARDHGDMTEALEEYERAQPAEFTALWRLAAYGYYSRPETIAAIQRDLAPAYHGAPLPLGYAHAIAPWDPDDPQQMPRTPRGSYTPTSEVCRVDLSALSFDEERQ